MSHVAPAPISRRIMRRWTRRGDTSSSRASSSARKPSGSRDGSSAHRYRKLAPDRRTRRREAAPPRRAGYRFRVTGRREPACSRVRARRRCPEIRPDGSHCLPREAALPAAHRRPTRSRSLATSRAASRARPPNDEPRGVQSRWLRRDIAAPASSFPRVRSTPGLRPPLGRRRGPKPPPSTSTRSAVSSSRCVPLECLHTPRLPR